MPEAPEMVIGETMITVRKVGMAVMVVMTMTMMLAACTTITMRSTGVVTGIADSCSGLEFVPHVKVRLYSGPTLLASETIRTGSRYRFSVEPGAYRVRTAARSKSVVVKGGQAVTANLRITCR